ncbi:hypothetical protein EGK76_14285 [Luteimonas sp. 100069]|nr:hypothetical protein EGK76_14285 [Luteimonas sp. 100069]
MGGALAGFAMAGFAAAETGAAGTDFASPGFLTPSPPAADFETGPSSGTRLQSTPFATRCRTSGSKPVSFETIRNDAPGSRADRHPM